jgi:hypothetical protein
VCQVDTLVLNSGLWGELIDEDLVDGIFAAATQGVMSQVQYIFIHGVMSQPRHIYTYIYIRIYIRVYMHT